MFRFIEIPRSLLRRYHSTPSLLVVRARREVKCQNRRRNFHSVRTTSGSVTDIQCWDTYIPDILEDQIGGFDGWPTLLKSQIDSPSSSFLSQPSDWISCVDLDKIESCAFAWAKESNAFTCSYVYANLDTSVDLAGDYAQGAFPIIETQIAKGGHHASGENAKGSRFETCGLFEFGCYWPAWLGQQCKLRVQCSILGITLGSRSIVAIWRAKRR